MKSVLNRLISTLILVFLIQTNYRTAQQEVAETASTRAQPLTELEIDVTNELKRYTVPEATDKHEKYFTVKFKSDDSNTGYQIQIRLETNGPVDFYDKCVFTLSYPNEKAKPICLESYVEILEANAILKIDRDVYSKWLAIEVRHVISGCDERTQVRNITFKPNLPNIYHISTNDCMYYLVNEQANGMVNASVISFPSIDSCSKLVKISTSNRKNDLVGQPQVIFYNNETIREFNSPIYITARFSIIKLSNCYENTNAIEIKLEYLKRSSSAVPSNIKEVTIDSTELVGGSKLNYVVYEAYGIKPTAKISAYLREFQTSDPVNDACASKFIIYGVNEFNNLIWYNHSCLSLGLPELPIEFKDMRRIFIQFHQFDSSFNDKSASAIDRFDKFILDLNVTNTNTNLISKIFTKRSGVYSSRLKREDLTNRQLDVEIKTPKGTQIIFTLNEFNNNLERIKLLSANKCRLKGENACGITKDQEVTECSDYVLVKINKSPMRLNSLYEDNSNPKICNSIREPITFNSYTNNLQISFSFSSKYLTGQKPFISFSYTSQKICNETSTKLSDIIKYDSSKSGVLRDSCERQITLPKDHRIIMYRVYWKLNEKGYLVDDQASQTYNQKSKCQNTDALVLREHAKELSQFSLFEASESYFCMDNPLNVYITKTNNLYLAFKSDSSNATRSRPLIFETGYFGYKYQYDESDKQIQVDFSRMIPKDLSKNSNPTSFSIRIKVPNEKYIVPVISNCNATLNNGKIYIKSGEFEHAFKIACGTVTYTTSCPMNSELEIEFKDVYLNELRDSSIRFQLDYTTLPRVMRDLNGEFESNNFEHHYLSGRKELVTYEWTIHIEPSYFIRLNILNLTNRNSIEQLKISDQRIDLYELGQLDENQSYLFASSNLTITLKYMKRSKTDGLPYAKFSYTAQPKVIQIDENRADEINIENVRIKDNLDWLITAPKEYNLLARLKTYQGKGQIKFSLLNDGYKPAGSYHFNLNQVQTNPLAHPTSFVLSKANQLRVQYFPSDAIDSFTLVYSSVKNVLTKPFGIIRPFTNDFISNEIASPKLTDQRWLIRAPYGKQIKLYAKKIDLYEEKPCFKASVNVYENEEANLASLCGSRVGDVNTLNHLVRSETNELNVQFVTQDLDDVVYWLQKDGTPEPYEGFELFYMFDEQPGDCYFRQKYSDCNYTTLASSIWLTESHDQAPLDKASFCFNCYLKSTLQTQSNDLQSEQLKSVLVTPLVNKSKEYIKFNYKLSKSAKLVIKIVYEHDYLTDKQEIKKTTLLNVLTSTESQWDTAMIKIGKLFYNYRIVFSLERADDDLAFLTQPVSVSLDDVQFFDKDLECESNEFANTCFISNQRKYEEEQDGDIKFCKQTVTPCSYNKCAQNSVCINLPDSASGYKCECGFGYTGVFCDTKLDPCESIRFNNCSTNSQCVKSTSSSPEIDNLDAAHMRYDCKCDMNYHGKYCENSFNPCKRALNPCNHLSGQGVCHDQATQENPDKYSCSCSSLYTGEQCETKLEMQCSNNEACRKFDKNASCIQFDDDTSVCLCSPGFEGDFCTNINDCAETTCLNGGTCLDGVNSFTCKCDAKYAGNYCEKAKICSLCQENGTKYCDQQKSECVCRESYSGEFCQLKQDPCVDNPCQNSGQCYSNKTDFNCICKEGFKGKRCELNETVCDKGLCLNDAECVLNTDSNSTELYTCKCAPNFSGRFCEHFNDPCNSNPCQNGGSCFGHKSSYKCGCSLDWTGKNCDEPVNNCANNNCMSGSTCVSLIDTYICLCPMGRIGQYCDQFVDKCAKNKCQNGKCMPNYMGTNYTCECLPGYEGTYCEHKINRCNPKVNPCLNDGLCIDLLHKHECKCPQTFSISNCMKTEYCSLEATNCNPEHTDRCEGYPGGSKCVCSPRYTGQRCEHTLDICEFERPCRSGECRSILNGTDYECVNCAPGFTGKQCNEMINFCESRPCQNNATCLTKPNDYYCKCSEGFVGKNCQNHIEIECLHHKCQHNSVCEPIKDASLGSNNYKCVCSENYEGLYCEKKKDLCKDKVCKFGYCVDGKCECDPRLTYCKDNSKCKQHVCLNGGECIDVIVKEDTIPQCLCPAGLTGQHCETSVYCNSSLGNEICGGPNRCKTYNKNYVCDCEKPLIGHACQKKISDIFPAYIAQLKDERTTRVREACKFGVSSQSKIFIGIVAVFVVMFLMVGFLIGHRMIKSFRKKYLSNSDFSKRNSSINSEELITKSMIKGPFMYDPKTPVASYACISKSDINKSGFSIPRPSVRLESKTLHH